MKKRSLFVAAYLAMGAAVMFTSCSNDDDIMNGGIEQGVEDAQVLTLQIASSGDGLSTRAGRPLLSSAAAQQIRQVALYFVATDGANKSKIMLKKWVDWNTAVPYEDGMQLEISLKSEAKQKLSDGSYTVYAVGYSGMSNEGTDYTFTPTAMFNDNGNQVQAGDNWSEFKATLNDGVKFAEEVFAGELDLTVEGNVFNLTADGKKQAIVLHRQVAGATGYFDNVPVSVDGKNSRYVRLVASAKNNTAKFEKFNSAFTHSPATTAQYIVNGSDAIATDKADAKFANGTAAYVVYQIDLGDWFNVDPDYTGKGYKGWDYNEDGFLGSADVKKYIEDKGISKEELKDYSYSAIWRNPNKSKGQSVYRGTVFGAEFVVPIEYTAGQNTLQLQVTDADGNVLKYWNINVANDQLHKQKENQDTAYDGEKFDLSASIFNIYRNHMYSVGMKADNTTPENPDPNPTDPDPEKPVDPENPDKEDPEDLSKGQDLIIQVNDNWEVIHRMEVD